MNNKQNNVSRLMEMQKKIQNLNKKTEETLVDKKIPVVEPEIIEEPKEDSALPSKFLSLSQVKLSAKEVANTTSFADKLKQSDEKYAEISITEAKANKIRKELVRLTTGVSSVVPLQCKGSQCSFASTCITGESIVSGYKNKKIKDISIGDKVYSFNLKSKIIEKDTVTNTKVIESKPVYKVITKYGKELKLTADHKVLVINFNNKLHWDSIDDNLSEEDHILLDDVDSIDDELNSYGDLFIDSIKSIEYVGEEDVYDITVSKNSNFFANNILVHNCPYVKEDVIPLGLPCPVENQLLEYWMEKYKEEYGIEDHQITDLHMVGRLCTFDIYEMRLTRYLSEHDQTLLVDFISSYDEEGNPISNKATSAAWDTIDKIDRMRSKLLKELMATRESKSKLMKTVNEANQNINLTALKTRFEEIIKKTEAKVVN